MGKHFITRGHKFHEGAKGILDETEVCDEVTKYLSEILQEMGEETKVFNSETVKDYIDEVNEANKGNYNYYWDVHANTNVGTPGTGTEIFSKIVREENKRILAEFEKLGFRNRGNKTSPVWYSIQNAKAKTIYMELFFINNEYDCNLYKKLGAKRIAQAMAEGCLNRKYIPKEESTTDGEIFYRVICGSFKDKVNAEKQKKLMEDKGITGVFIDKYVK